MLHLDFDFQRCTRKCAVTGREFQPGDAYISLVVVERGKPVRQDFSPEAWRGPPEDNLGWWRAEVPRKDETKPRWAPNEVMLQMLQRLLDDATEPDLCYVLGLLLARRKILRLEDSDDQQTLLLYSVKEDTEFRVPVVEPSSERIVEIQTQLGELLYSGEQAQEDKLT